MNTSPGHSQNLNEYNLDQDPSSDCFHDDLTSSICVILPTQIGKQRDKQTIVTDSHKNNTSLVEVIINYSNPYVIVIQEIGHKYYYRKHSDRVKVKGWTKVTI